MASKNERNAIAALSLSYNIYVTMYDHYRKQPRNDKIIRYLDRLCDHIKECRACYQELDAVDAAKCQRILNEYERRTLDGYLVDGVTLVFSAFRIVHSVSFKAEKGDYVWRFKDPVKRASFDRLLDDLCAIKDHIDRRLSFQSAYDDVTRLIEKWWIPSVMEA